MAKYYISDLHIGHLNCLKFDNRPFSSLEEMKQTIITNWNSVVSSKDTVYVLGDMFWNNNEAVEVLQQLNGSIYLIKGNHDRVNAEMTSYFTKITNYLEIKDEGYNIVLCHYPIAHWHNSDHGTIHLYGHIHAGRDSRPFESYAELMRQQGFPYKCFNVGCMMSYMNYKPRTLKEILTSNILNGGTM